MSSIPSLQTKMQSDETNRQQMESIKNERKMHNKRYEVMVKENEKNLGQVEKDYNAKISNMKLEVDRKLQEMREKQVHRIAEEQNRLEVEIDQLKKSNIAKRGEIINGQEEEILKLVESHDNQLENAKKQFEKRMSKYSKSS